MPNHQGCIRRTAGSWLPALALLTALAASASAGVIYDSGGFEAPTFSVGALAGQDSGKWVESGSGATAVVQNSIASSGSQAVQVQRTTGDDRFFPILPTTPTVKRFVTIDWDMNVARTALDNVSFGPFFGIQAYTPATLLLGAAGVDATTGDVLFEAPNSGVLTVTGTKVNFDQFNHFQLVIDNTAKSVSVLVNNKLAHKANGFVDPGATGFSDADISALAAQSEPPTEPGTAIFDNYKVATSATPPVNMVALPSAFWSGVAGLLFAGCLALRYRHGRTA
jgi:hypothetical protein